MVLDQCQAIRQVMIVERGYLRSSDEMVGVQVLRDVPLAWGRPAGLDKRPKPWKETYCAGGGGI